jgi:hypothetical protein
MPNRKLEPLAITANLLEVEAVLPLSMLVVVVLLSSLQPKEKGFPCTG